MSKNAQQPKYLVEAKGPEIDETAHQLMDHRRHKYLLINVISRRARDLNRGERALVDLPLPHTPADVAMAEVETERLTLVRKQTSKVLVSLIKND